MEQTYVSSIETNREFSAADLPLDTVLNWIKSLQTLAQVRESFIKDFSMRLVSYLGRTVDWAHRRQCAIVAAAIIAVGAEEHLRSAVDILNSWPAQNLLDYGRELRSALETTGVDCKCYFFVSIAKEAFSKQKAYVDKELQKFTIPAQKQANSWPCGTACATCGPTVCQFLQEATEKIVWKCKFVSKQCIDRDSKHVIGAPALRHYFRVFKLFSFMT
jgi:bacterioferritin-associated ferredoxin